LSNEQRENIEAALRRSPVPAGSSVSEQRRLPGERASARPTPADVTVTPAQLGGVPAADIAFAGDSAGGGLAVAAMVSARDHGLPRPAAAFLLSPYADLTLAGSTMDAKSDVDVVLSRELLQPRGSRRRGHPGRDPKVPHVFQNFYPILDEAADALDRAGQFLTAHLASPARV
jgi:hypothetical protein